MYKMAAHCLPNQFTKTAALTAIKNNTNDVSKVHFKGLILPLVMFSFYFSFMRVVSNFDEFLINIFSILNTFRSIIYLPYITKPNIRSTILKAYIENITSGSYPHTAWTRALRGRNLNELVYIPISNSTKSNNQKRNQSKFRQAPNFRKFPDRERKFPDREKKCNSCGELVRGPFRDHNRICTKRRDL